MKWRAGDCIIAAVVVILAAAIWIYPLTRDGKKAQSAEIRHNGELVKSATLESDGLFTVGGCKIAVENGEVFVSEADCPDRVCIKTGKISRSGQSIICVPNGVSVRISGETEYDAVAG